MQIEVFKSKIHRVTITEANLSYVGSITIDEDLLDAANMIAGEKVQIVNVNNGERLETYIIKGGARQRSRVPERPAARRCVVGDVVIIISYALMDFEEAKTFAVGRFSRHGDQQADQIGFRRKRLFGTDRFRHTPSA